MCPASYIDSKGTSQSKSDTRFGKKTYHDHVVRNERDYLEIY